VAAKYAKSNKATYTASPSLYTNTAEAEANTDKAKVLLDAFFPPLLPIQQEDTGDLPTPILMEPITDHKIRSAAININQWKAPGQDSLPIAV
jgi:hypothetical protein